MKKIVLLVLVFIILGSGGFLLVDKFYLHLIFKVSKPSDNVEATKTVETLNNTSGAIPGNCLILEEEYCKLGELIYDENDNTAVIVFKVPKDIKIFSPIDGYYSTITNTDDKALFINEKEGIDIGDSVLQYQISFKGSLSPSIKETVKGSNEIMKGSLIGKTSDDQSVVVLSTRRLSVGENSQISSSFNIDDLKKFSFNQ